KNLKSWKRSHERGARSTGKRNGRKLQPWRDNEKWKGDADNDELPKWQRESETPKWRRNQKWKETPPGQVPKWQRTEKWKNEFCVEDECPQADANGITGRVCDDSCADGVPYGTLGCEANDG
ncbi:hypothetical protein, partial [Salmonella sp. s58408]|uniref:hypothetical protein n=1 Tax=Salmonella sp. s58408 TaxID=3159701 RepID=UPI003980D9DB